MDEIRESDYKTVTSAILSVSRRRSLPEATVRFNFNSLAKKGIIDREAVRLTSLGSFILGLEGSGASVTLTSRDGKAGGRS